MVAVLTRQDSEGGPESVMAPGFFLSLILGQARRKFRQNYRTSAGPYKESSRAWDFITFIASCMAVWGSVSTSDVASSSAFWLIMRYCFMVNGFVDMSAGTGSVVFMIFALCVKRLQEYT
jgi:hypothetical protein